MERILKLQTVMLHDINNDGKYDKACAILQQKVIINIKNSSIIYIVEQLKVEIEVALFTEYYTL